MANKALTKEDLIYILDSIFQISKDTNNAFKMKTDGLFVDDYKQPLQEHKDNDNLHITEFIRNILNKFSVDDNNNLYYDSVILNTTISKEKDNGIKEKEDGLYYKDYSDDITKSNTHINNKDIHITAEERESWNTALENAKKFVIEEIAKLVIYDFEIVKTLPQPKDISPSRLYLLKDDVECPADLEYTTYLYINDNWRRLTLSKSYLDTLATKEDLKEYAKSTDTHFHSNKEILDKINTDENGNLMYDNKDISSLNISDKSDNALTIINGKVYAKDYSKEINAIEIASAFSKVNLYNEECPDSGVYELKDFIDDYNLLLIEYYYKPNDGDEDLNPGNAKTAIIDVDTINDLYRMGIDYMLELGYGVSCANSKIRMKGDKLWVNYYHGCCIYKITGIRKGVDKDE